MNTKQAKDLSPGDIYHDKFGSPRFVESIHEYEEYTLVHYRGLYGTNGHDLFSPNKEVELHEYKIS